MAGVFQFLARQMKAIVAQIGARHHYAVPRMLARRDRLRGLYTDSCANRGVGRVLRKVVPRRLRSGKLAQFLEREIIGVPGECIYSTDQLLWNRVMGRRAQDAFANLDNVGATFSREMIRWGVGNATHVYSMFGEGIEFLHFAKERGLKICIDVFITPVAHRIIAEERRRFPDWEGEALPWDERLEPRIREIIELADLLLCPGTNVVEGLNEFGHYSAKIRYVPYGSGANFGGRINQPVVGRVLFGGTAELRKGIHYFAAAAKQLEARGYEFRVAGGVTDQIRRLPECGALNFLGRLSRVEMVEELLRADALVLPTVAEGSASVINEALVVGLPVITTGSAGSIVNHGHNGLLVPERDSTALASAIEKVIIDRALREALASGGRATTPLLLEDEWGRRLLAALDEPATVPDTVPNQGFPASKT
jgi:glycosyltransferase involved in cell wall biosynthesis